MITNELKQYLDNLKARPVLPSDEAVRRAMLSVGWGEEDIREGLLYLRTKVAPAASVRAFPGNSFATGTQSVNVSPQLKKDESPRSVNPFVSQPNSSGAAIRNINIPPVSKSLAQNIPLQPRQPAVPFAGGISRLNEPQVKVVSGIGEDGEIKTAVPTSSAPPAPQTKTFARPLGSPIPREGYMKEPIRPQLRPQPQQTFGPPPPMAGLGFEPTKAAPVPPFYSSESKAAIPKEHTILQAQTEDYARMAEGEQSAHMKAPQPAFGKPKFVPPPRFGGPGHADPSARLQKAMLGIVVGAVVLIGVAAGIFYAFIEGIGPFSKNRAPTETSATRE